MSVGSKPGRRSDAATQTGEICVNYGYEGLYKNERQIDDETSKR